MGLVPGSDGGCVVCGGGCGVCVGAESRALSFLPSLPSLDAGNGLSASLCLASRGASGN